ncbi:MAG TPA: protein DA1 [Ktedonobacteraceae bacterium]|nr:protein DA1 [Ktedonobacteraceae bacterium]
MMSVQPICRGCGQPIWGEYLNALGGQWHPEHFVCAGCHRPIRDASFLTYEGAPYHTDCYRNQILPRCAYCGKPMDKFMVDHWGTKYCRHHQDAYPSCVYCGRLVPPEQQEPGAEHIRCPVCRSTAITSAAEAKPIFSNLIRWVSSQGLTYNNLRLSLELHGRARLSQLLRERDQPHSLGVTTSTTYTQNGHVERTEVNGIAVLEGLPSTLFQGVTIHELGHVWLIVHGIQDLPIWAAEGFCEYLSYRYYMDMNTPESRYHALCIEQNKDRVYGDGFRHMRTLVDKYGFSRLLEILDTTKRLPSR